MSDMTEATLTTEWRLDSEYTCKNRAVKSKVSVKSYVKYIGYKTVWMHVVICRTHRVVCEFKDEYRSKALYAQRKPWLWCDECAKIHEVAWLGHVKSEDL